MTNRSCPRCKGFMHTNRDMYGEYRECLQCGYMEDAEKRIDIRLLQDPEAAEDVA